MAETQEDPSPSPTGDLFAPWLNAVTTAYLSLKDDERNMLFKHLIANSEPNQLSFLTAYVPTILCRDFISCLPSEIILSILKYLDGKQLTRVRRVCKTWRNRIDTLADLWQDIAYNSGVDTQAISSKYPDFRERARVLQTSFRLAEQFLAYLKQEKVYMERVFPGYAMDKGHTDFYLSSKNIAIGDCMSGIVDVYSIPAMRLKYSVRCRKFSSLLQYKNTYVITTASCGNVYCWNVNFKVDKNDEQSEFDANGVAKVHALLGHTSSVMAVDIIETKGVTYAITGSVDKTVKVWVIHKTRIYSELFTTFEAAHTTKVLEVHFLPCGENGELRFISCDTKSTFVWSLDVQTGSHKSCRLGFNDDFASFFMDPARPGQVFISQWDFSNKQSTLVSYQISKREVKIVEKEQWKVPAYGLKAFITGVGSRFALLMCSISMQEFLLFDLISGRSLTIFTMFDTFKSFPVKVYDMSWLDGFVFEKKANRMPTLIGYNSFFRNGMAMLRLNFPVVAHDIFAMGLNED